MTWPDLFHFLWHWFVLLIGGWIVIAGLLLEDIPDWRWFKWSKEDPRRHTIGRIAIYVIVVGILIESVQTVILDVEAANARLETATLEKQIAETKNSVVKIDPLNQAISTGAATVSLVLSGQTNLDNVGRISTNGYAFISFCRLDQVTTGLDMNTHILMCSGWEHPDPNMWSFKFDQGTSTYFAHDTWVGDVKKWNVTELFIPSLHRDTEIVGGRMLLTVNATSWDIAIPPQKVVSREAAEEFLKHPFPAIFVVGQ